MDVQKGANLRVLKREASIRSTLFIAAEAKRFHVATLEKILFYIYKTALNFSKLQKKL